MATRVIKEKQEKGSNLKKGKSKETESREIRTDPRGDLSIVKNKIPEGWSKLRGKG